MKTLKNIIIEKLILNKNIKSYKNSYCFIPKYCGDETYAKKINNLKISLPFNIIANNNIIHNKKVTIEKIIYSTEYDFDAWDLFDKDNLKVIGLTSAGVYQLFISNEEINNHFYEGDSADIILDKYSCKIELS